MGVMAMTMSTQTLAESSRLLELLFMDELQIMTVGAPVTEGINVTRSLTPLGAPVAGLVQTSGLANAVESQTQNVYSVKVPRTAPLAEGLAVKVLRCVGQPSLVGRVLLIDKITENSLAMLIKGTASDFSVVNQEGKGVLE
jgi:hypothetical protein